MQLNNNQIFFIIIIIISSSTAAFIFSPIYYSNIQSSKYQFYTIFWCCNRIPQVE